MLYRMAIQMDFSERKINNMRRLRTRLQDTFDVSYDVAQIRIDSFEAFERELLAPFLKSSGIYYRGERICSPSRRLLPTFLRKAVFEGDELYTNLDAKALFDFYAGKKAFTDVYTTLYGLPDPERQYKMLAFAQHYLDISPFIDFSASLYVAMSFAMKGRTEFSDDIVIYTAFDIGDDDTTTDENEVNEWLSGYNVGIVRAESKEEFLKLLSARRKSETENGSFVLSPQQRIEAFFNGISPTAKLINIPTNDLMKYQQGVFLLLNDFCLMDKSYFTKTVRQSFVIKKYVIDKDVCPVLQKLLQDKAPQYRYSCLMDISEAVKG